MKKRKDRRSILLVFLLVAGCIGTGCGFLAPTPPPYPDWRFVPNGPTKTEAELQAYADQWSSDLEAYIKDWAAGRVPAAIPESLIPPGTKQLTDPNMGPSFKDFYLANPDSIPNDNKWGIKTAEAQVDLQRMHPNFCDPHAAYVISKPLLVPHGTEVSFDGDFPYCRFFSIQVLGGFDPWEYCAEGGVGIGETSYVDTDIEPDAGHVNPFRVGANRAATNRHYHFTVAIRKGKTSTYDTTSGPPYWRKKSSNPVNRLAGGSIIYQGPFADHNELWGNVEGRFKMGRIWLRYYGTDKSKVSDGGVAFPNLTYRLPTGEQFIVGMDYSISDIKYDSGIKSTDSCAQSPDDPGSDQQNKGWEKMFGIFLEFVEYGSDLLGKDPNYMRALDLGATGRGQNQPGALGWETASTKSNYFNYLTQKFLFVGDGRIMVLTGKLPKCPKTRNGETSMPGNQARYYSQTAYTWELSTNARIGHAVNSAMDDEYIVDANNNYVLCYSRTVDRPSNATSNAGVTWMDCGKESHLILVTRWCTVYPEWYMSNGPYENRCTWDKTTRSGLHYDPNLLNTNKRSGMLGEYLPKTNFMKKSAFEKMGSPVTWAKVDATSWGACGTAMSAHAGGLAILVPLCMALVSIVCWRRRRT